MDSDTDEDIQETWYVIDYPGTKSPKRDIEPLYGVCLDYPHDPPKGRVSLYPDDD